MNISGIVAEFNPLHKGHEYLMNTAKEDSAVVVALSGNFVQRGDVAICEKRKRTEMALRCGADLVIELPVLWSMSTAGNFALGAVSALSFIGCNHLCFGSEDGDVTELIKTAEILDSKDFSDKFAQFSQSGETFAKIRQTAAEECGAKKDILKGANNNLAIEYILAAKRNNFNLSFVTAKRRGAAHDSHLEDEFVSASLLREKLKDGNFDFCREYMPETAFSLIKSYDIADIKNIEKSILAVLRAKTREDLKKLPDLSEGVENKLYDAIRVAESLETLYNEIKVKRYTLARVRRLVLSAFLGLDNEFFMKSVPYVRVLGFNKIGEQILRDNAKKSPVPIVSTVAQIKELDKFSQKVFEYEAKATDLFSLSLPQILPCGLEYTSKIIKTGVF